MFELIKNVYEDLMTSYHYNVLILGLEKSGKTVPITHLDSA